MRLSGSTLIETLIALSIMAFTTMGALNLLSMIKAKSDQDTTLLYLELRNLEQLPLNEDVSWKFGTHTLLRRISSAKDGIYIVESIATNASGREILRLRKLVDTDG